MATTPVKVLVVGATGQLGGLVVRHLLARGHPVRALVRPGSDATALEKQGVEVVRGDMLQPATLQPAMVGAGAVVTTAAGYTRRRRGDSLETDHVGNRNLVDAAKAAGVGVFVFTSVLTCDRAASVPHFHAKYVTETYLIGQGVPYVILRPGAFLYAEYMKGLRRDGGKVTAIMQDGRHITWIHPDDVARCLAAAVSTPAALNRVIDLGSDRPADGPALAATFTQLLRSNAKDTQDAAVAVGHLPLWLLRPIGWFSGFVADMVYMIDYFNTGVYVANTTAQAELFGPVPTLEEGCGRVLQELGLAATTS
jgi:uncharacterized protein YbjT (DUF2867 family)